MIAYKFRLYPTSEQERQMKFIVEQCRRVYNSLIGYLEVQKQKFDKIDRAKTQKLVTIIVMSAPILRQAPFNVLQYENWKIFRQLKTLKTTKAKGNKVGRLRFARFGEFNSFTYNSAGYKLKYESGKFGKLRLSKIGEVKIRVHRKPFGRINNVIVKREGSKWFACMTSDWDYGIVGIDLGLINFVYDSYGKYWDNPKYLDKFAVEKKALQQSLSRKKKGSSNRSKARLLLANAEAKIVRCRDDFLHKVSDYYASRYRVVVMEDLDIKNMLEKRYNCRTIMDASWGKFAQMLDYKLKQRGGQLVKVNPAYTSQDCSSCGARKKLHLWDRKYKCENCGAEFDRDLNGALNILNRYLHSQELTSAESLLDNASAPLKEKEVLQDSMKQEATCSAQASK